MWIALLLAGALTSSEPLVGKFSPAQDQDPVNLPEIVVEGRSTESQARDFIREVSAPSKGAALARWRSSICIGAVNLGSEGGRYLVDRVASTAAAVGLEVGGPGCTPDVVIIATSDADQVADDLIDRHSRTLYPGGSGFSRSRAALQRFASSDEPVRWWHVTQPTDPRTGRRAVHLPGVDAPAISLPDDPDGVLLKLPQVTVPPTLLRAPNRQDLTRAFIVIDFEQIEAVNFDQLADYVTFIALAQVDPAAQTGGFSTILNVFDDPASTPGLSDWDRAYLTGLYQSDETGNHPSARAAALRRDMVGVVVEPAANPGN